MPRVRLGDMFDRAVPAAPPEPERAADEWPNQPRPMRRIDVPEDDIVPEFDDREDILGEEGFPEPAPPPDLNPMRVMREQQRIEELLRRMQIDEEERRRIRADRERFLNGD